MAKSLRDRLAQFDRGRDVPQAVAATTVSDGRRAAMAALVARGAEWVSSSPQGHLRLIEEVDLGERGRIDAAFWPRAGLPLPEPDGPWGILDTETTGLESGTGTVVFLVALLKWEAGRGRLIQFLLPEPAGEKSLWADVADEIDDCSLLISYNGKSFDIPRMRTRMRLHRIRTRCLDRAHADLLHPTRSITRHWLGSSRLAHIESEVLGIDRLEDLPGSMAPEVYRRLQVEGVDSGLAEVLRHNRDDVVHLSRLLFWLASVHSEEQWRELPPVARLDLARAAARRGAESFALGVLQSLERESAGGLRGRARSFAALLHRRRGEFGEAERDLVRSLEDRPSALDTRVQLAKLYEHKLGDLPRAHELTRECLSIAAARTQGHLRSREDGGQRRGNELEELLHRKRRLERKLRRRHGHE